MIDDHTRSETEKLSAMVNMALEIDLELLRQVRPDAEFLATALEGWVGDMMRVALASMDAFIEYRTKLDGLLAESGLDMLLMKGWPKDA